MSVKGNPLTGLVRLEGYPKRQDDGFTVRILDKYACLYTLVESLMPSQGDAHPDFPDYKLQSREWERDGDAAVIILTYGTEESSLSGVDSGLVTFRSDAAIDIDPNTGKSEPAIDVTITEHVSVFEKTEANLVRGVGFIGAPDQVNDATIAKWKKIGRSAERTSQGWVVSETYRYRTHDW